MAPSIIPQGFKAATDKGCALLPTCIVQEKSPESVDQKPTLLFSHPPSAHDPSSKAPSFLCLRSLLSHFLFALQSEGQTMRMRQQKIYPAVGLGTTLVWRCCQDVSRITDLKLAKKCLTCVVTVHTVTGFDSGDKTMLSGHGWTLVAPWGCSTVQSQSRV